MSVLNEVETWEGVARAVAWEYGVGLSTDDADFVLWEHTGYPGFWKGDPRDCCVEQLREFFAGSAS